MVENNISQFVNDPGFPIYADAVLIRDYLEAGVGPPPLLTSIGDASFTSAQVPSELLSYYAAAPRELHGYQASMGGLPTARRSICEYIRASTGLDEVARYGVDFEIALTAGGTRGVMGDFARLLRKRTAGTGAIPVALCANPAWDYAGPMVEAGWDMAYWPLRSGKAWDPDPQDAEKVAAEVSRVSGKGIGLVIVNAQHNPTGRGWSEQTLIALYEIADRYGAALLLDDPYFEVHAPGARPVAAPRVLLDYLRRSRGSRLSDNWCAVRSLGKQLGVNGWGVGTLTAAPGTVRDLMEHAFRRRFPGNAHHEWAVANYLNDPQSVVRRNAQQTSLLHNRQELAQAFRSFGWPERMLSAGEFTPYLLVAVPPSWGSRVDEAEEYRRHIFNRSGVLVSHASIENAGLAGDGGGAAWLRFYLGVTEEVLSEIVDRLKRANLSY